ncbi:uncharacterized protein LOC125945830 [Dermacentor silvarum]|uniref:uncharacterized protein LOC125945830 n=1 Tax=Dermacentor silvarum TaxID=543639 RepID=UPI002100E8E4|nr:uncharacterized protein LOC125945830 [Dermacentor silvarum]
MHQVVEGLNGVAVVMDDILVWGKSREEHDNNLAALLARCREHNLKLNKKKCHFLQPQVRYMGHILTQEGLCLDPGRVKDILQVAPAKDFSDRQRQGIREALLKDATMMELCNYSSNEWPESKQQVSEAVRAYWNYRDELHVEDGLLLRSKKLIKQMRRTTAEAVTNLCMQIFATHGIPAKICSDNGPPFNSACFRVFSTQLRIVHETSCPHYPGGNGMAERAVQEAKKLLKKCRYGTLEFCSALLEWRNMPRDDRLKSPAQRLMGRQTRTKLPVLECHLEPQTVPTKIVRKRLDEIRRKQRVFYNRTTRSLPDIHRGSTVTVYDTTHRTWAPAIVIGPASTPRSYVVETENGQHLRRTKEHLRSTEGQASSQQPECTIATPQSSSQPCTTEQQAPQEALRRSTRQRREPQRWFWGTGCGGCLSQVQEWDQAIDLVQLEGPFSAAGCSTGRDSRREILVEFMERHLYLVKPSCALNSKLTAARKEELWKELVSLLNNEGSAEALF